MNEIMPQRIREARENAGLSRKQLAKEIFVARTTLGGWETGRHCPSVWDIQTIARRCDVTVAWIIGETDERPTATTAMALQEAS